MFQKIIVNREITEMLYYFLFRVKHANLNQGFTFV